MSDDFDPEAGDARESGRASLEGDDGLGSTITHLYRAEVDRETSWRQRMDSSTNWAVTVIAGILAYSFSSDQVSHSILLVGIGIGVVFLLIEARRFQRYDVWRSRVRSMQQNFFANALDPSRGVEHRDWRRQLSEDYRNPAAGISLRGALAHRLRRVYLPLLTGILLVWVLRLGGADEPIVRAAAIGDVPGWAVIAGVAIWYACFVVLAFWPGTGEVSETDADVDRGDLGDEQ
ncbi:DUF2270 domain-containing protein [Salinarchaeum chitinilyticum]